MRFTPIALTVLAFGSFALAVPASTPYDQSLGLVRRGGCSGGVHVCCGSTSVGCSGNVCKACCGNQCGCFYTRGGTCSSDPNVTPCVDVTKPDFAVVNGKCTAPSSGGILGGSSGGGSTGGTSGTGSQPSYCSKISQRFKFLFGC